MIATKRLNCNHLFIHNLNGKQYWIRNVSWLFMITFPLLYIIRCYSPTIMCKDSISKIDYTCFFGKRKHAFMFIHNLYGKQYWIRNVSWLFMITFPLLYIIRCYSPTIMCKDSISKIDYTCFFGKRKHAFMFIHNLYGKQYWIRNVSWLFMITFPLLYIIRCYSPTIMCKDSISKIDYTCFFGKRKHAFRLKSWAFMVCEKSNISK